MSKELKKDWLPKLQQRYERRKREGKTRMLDELCSDYKYERESIGVKSCHLDKLALTR